MRKAEKPIFKGCATALATPFKNGNIDLKSFESIIERQIEHGVSALVVCGTTGEASTMSIAEHLRCVEFVLERAQGRVPIIAGSGNNCTKKAIELSRACCSLGCEALLVVTPYYNKTSDEGLIKHFSLIADAADKPILLYNVPSRTGVNIPLSVYYELSKHDNIFGVKEANGNLSSIAALRANLGDGFDIYSGNDDQILPILSLGGLGVVSVVSNLLPSETEDICKYYFSNDTKNAQKAQLNLIDLISVLFCEVNPIPLKYALSLMDLCAPDIRAPLCEPSDKSKAIINECLKKYGMI